LLFKKFPNNIKNDIIKKYPMKFISHKIDGYLYNLNKTFLFIF